MLPTNLNNSLTEIRDRSSFEPNNKCLSHGGGLTELTETLLNQVGEYLLSPSSTTDFRRFSQTCKPMHAAMNTPIEGQSLLDKARIFETTKPVLRQVTTFPEFFPRKSNLTAFFRAMPLFDLAVRFGSKNEAQLSQSINGLLTRLTDHRIQADVFREKMLKTGEPSSNKAQRLFEYHHTEEIMLENKIIDRLKSNVPEDLMVAGLMDSNPRFMELLCTPGDDVSGIVNEDGDVLLIAKRILTANDF